MHKDGFQRLKRGVPPSDHHSVSELMVFAHDEQGRVGQVDHADNSHLFAWDDEVIKLDRFNGVDGEHWLGLILSGSLGLILGAHGFHLNAQGQNVDWVNVANMTYHLDSFNIFAEGTMLIDVHGPTPAHGLRIHGFTLHWLNDSTNSFAIMDPAGNYIFEVRADRTIHGPTGGSIIWNL
jgi:hypothetical protein